MDGPAPIAAPRPYTAHVHACSKFAYTSYRNNEVAIINAVGVFNLYAKTDPWHRDQDGKTTFPDDISRVIVRGFCFYYFTLAFCDLIKHAGALPKVVYGLAQVGASCLSDPDVHLPPQDHFKALRTALISQLEEKRTRRYALLSNSQRDYSN